MFKKLKNLFIVAAGLAVIATPALVPAIASAQVTVTNETNALCSGAALDFSGNTDCSSLDSNSNGASDLQGIITTIINLFSIIVGAVAIIMIIIGGFRYVVSGGNDNSVSGAKNTIIFALVGLIIVALAQTIVHFVLDKVTS